MYKMSGIFSYDDETLEESAGEDLWIEVKGLGFVVLKRNMDGLSIDVWDKHPADEPISANYFLNEDFNKEDEEWEEARNKNLS